MNTTYRRQPLSRQPLFKFTETQKSAVRRLTGSGMNEEDARLSVMRPAQKALWLLTQFAALCFLAGAAIVILILATA